MSYMYAGRTGARLLPQAAGYAQPACGTQTRSRLAEHELAREKLIGGFAPACGRP